MLNITPKPVASANYHQGRAGRYPSAIVIHITDSDDRKSGADGTDAWFNNPLAKVSAHYLICRDGQVHKYVQESDTAFHAGLIDHPTWEPATVPHFNPNLSTIGIEHEGVPTEDITPIQYDVSSELIAKIADRWLFDIGPLTVVPHHAIRASKSCPGLIDIPKLILMASKFKSTFKETIS